MKMSLMRIQNGLPCDIRPSTAADELRPGGYSERHGEVTPNTFACPDFNARPQATTFLLTGAGIGCKLDCNRQISHLTERVDDVRNIGAFADAYDMQAET